MDVGRPVELPRPRVELELGRRRHRVLTGPAGLLLFVCLFLPAVKGCNEPVYPIEMPMFWHPYVYGLVLAVCTAGTTLRAVRRTSVSLRALACLTAAGGLVLMLRAPALGVVELVLGLILFAIIGRSGCAERRAAGSAILISSVSVLWFGLWAMSSDALIGAYLSFAASIFLLAGTLLWLGEISEGQGSPRGASPRATRAP